MRRFAYLAALLGAVILIPGSLAAQTKPAPAKPTAAPPAQSPSAPAKWVPAVKGEATVEYLEPIRRRSGKEIVTTLKVRNVSKGSINLLRIEEFWYERSGKMAPGDTYIHRKPFLPGEILDVTLRRPDNPEFYSSNFSVSHANGKVVMKKVKKFE